MEIKEYTCSRCGKPFQDSVNSHFVGKGPAPGKTCRQCHIIVMRLAALERELLAKEFPLEKEDEHLALQIHSILEKSEISDEENGILTALLKKMLADEKREKKILKHILALQNKK